VVRHLCQGGEAGRSRIVQGGQAQQVGLVLGSIQTDAEVWFGGLDDEERVDKILGNEYATIYLNECSQISEHARDTAMTRFAQNVPGLKPMMFYDCNPSSTRHWSYRDFIGEKRDLERPVCR
jgi:phage terminase large subunit